MNVIASEVSPLSLPLEIWSQMFSYLPFEDRRNVRLTCRCFYEACCSYQIQKNEEIIFRRNSNVYSAIQYFCGVERKTWNIKLCEVYLMDNTVLPFFEKHGANIRSLILVNCNSQTGILRDILRLCSNLDVFGYSFISELTLHCSSHYNKHVTIFSDLELLQREEIYCAKVTHLIFELKEFSPSIITNKKLLQFFSIFPNIKKLNLTIASNCIDLQESSLSSDITSDEIFSYSCIYHQLSRIRHQLEELSLYIWNLGEYWSACETLSKISSIEMKNLKKLSSNCNSNFLFAEHFSNFQHLTDLTCVIIPETMLPSTQILLILNSATQLHSLSISTQKRGSGPYEMSKECFVAFVKSQLKILNIWCDILYYTCSPRTSCEAVKADFEVSSLDRFLAQNYTMEHLDLHSTDPTLLFLFSKYFSCLEDMSVKKAREDIMYNIFNYQTKVRSLTLYHCEKYPFSRIRPKDNPFENRLRNLEISSNFPSDKLIHLCIHDNISLDLTRFMLSEFVCSKLKSLTIEMDDPYPKMNCNIEALWQIIKKSTQLEYLDIQWRTVVSFQQWLILFESLPKLRHFSSADCCLKFFDDSEYRQLFHVRSSLRSVYHSSKKKKQTIMFVNDVLKNSIESQLIQSVTYSFVHDSFKMYSDPSSFHRIYKNCYRTDRDVLRCTNISDWKLNPPNPRLKEKYYWMPMG